MSQSSNNSMAGSSAGFLARLGASVLVLTCLAVATGFWWSQRHSQLPEKQIEQPKPAATTPTKVDGQPQFADWPKDAPDLVIVLSGQTYGYLQPCGCSRPQQGGLERRFNFVQSLKAKGWPVVSLDVGDVLPKPPGSTDELAVPAEQVFKKYEYTMKAYKEIGYAAVGVGEYDYKRDLFQLLPRYALNNPDKPPYILSGNVAGVERNGAGAVTKTTSREKYFGSVDGKPQGRDAVGIGLVVEGKIPVGVIGVAAPSVADAITDNDKKGPYQFAEYTPKVKDTLTAFAKHPAKPELNVLLLQGNTTEAQQAAANLPGVQIIACLSDSSEPPGTPIVVEGTKQHVIEVGWKGRYVGVIGVFKTAKGFDFKYQLVPLGEEYLTPDNAEALKANPVLQLLEELAKEVKDANYLKGFTAKRPQHPAALKNPTADLKYTGSEACAKCHAAEYKVWSEHKHSHAYEALEKLAKRPGLQNFNGECLVCHTTGFRYEGGFESKEKTPLLLNNGCENCHGPGSAHAAKPRDAGLIAAMLPWRTGPADKLPPKAELQKYGDLSPLDRDKANIPNDLKRLMNVKIAGLCMRCHDGDNDPKFDPWVYMPKIYHSNLKQAGLPGGAK